MIETLVASALLGVALIGLVGSLSTFAIGSRQAENRSEAQAVARAQAARINAAPYQEDGDYGAYLEPLPTGFSRTLTATWWDGVSAWSTSQNARGLQRIDLALSAGGTTMVTLQFAKAQR